MSLNRSVHTVTHGLQPMTGRDPDEVHRAATPLELLYDLAFVIAFGVAGSEFAHLLAEGEYRAGLVGFAFATFAVVWAWINFAWFASAYDTDDWVYRVATTVQMMGVVVLALGLPAMFDSLHHSDTMHNEAMVVGYVIMRVPMVVQWLRVARQDPPRRSCALTYVASIGITQTLWIALLLLDVDPYVWVLVTLPVVAAEMLGPYLAERRGASTPWHAHHIAERYGLLTIITLGEVMIGAVASLSAVIELSGWSVDVAFLLVGGVGLTVGMWWTYFFMPSGALLHRRRDVAFFWGYGHMFVFPTIAGVGAGLHVAALYIEHEAHISATAVMLTIAVPVAAFFAVITVLVARLIGLQRTAFATFALKLGMVALSVGLAAGGVRLATCVVVLALAPAVSVVAHELGIGAMRREAYEAEIARLDGVA